MSFDDPQSEENPETEPAEDSATDAFADEGPSGETETGDGLEDEASPEGVDPEEG
jgi:hypothetical protein